MLGGLGLFAVAQLLVINWGPVSLCILYIAVPIINNTTIEIPNIHVEFEE